MRTKPTVGALIPAGDYRLVAPAVSVWLVTALGLWHPGVVGIPAIVGAALVGAVAFGAKQKLGESVVATGAMTVAVAMSVVVPAAAALAFRMEARDAHPLAQRSGKTRIVVSIRDDPVRLGPAERGQVRVRVGVPGGVADLVGSAAHWSELLPGQKVSTLLRVRPPRGGDLIVARLTSVGDPTVLGRPPPHQRIAGVVRARLRESAARALGPRAAGLLPGLVLGDTSMLDDEVRDDFKAAGLTHLTAVSGANIKYRYG